MEINIEINRKWFEEHKDDFIKAYSNQEFIEDDEKGTCYKLTLSDVENCEHILSEREDNIKFVGGNPNEVWIDVEDKPTIQELLNLATIISKYYNKAKSAIEALK